VARNWWYYRVFGDSRERPFGNYTKPGGAGSISTIETVTGTASMIYTITERGPGAGNPIRFTAVLAYTLSSGPGGAWPLLEMSLAITTRTAAPLTIAFYNYLDADVQGTASNDSAMMSAPGVIRITDAGGFPLYHAAAVPDAYRVTAANTLRSALLNNSITNLNNTGLPFSNANYTGAWQWNVSLAPNQTSTIYSVISTSDPGTLPPAGEVPEPSSLALVLLGAAAMVGARRVRR
jgi:hypothetical protein